MGRCRPPGGGNTERQHGNGFTLLRGGRGCKVWRLQTSFWTWQMSRSHAGHQRRNQTSLSHTVCMLHAVWTWFRSRWTHNMRVNLHRCKWWGWRLPMKGQDCKRGARGECRVWPRLTSELPISKWSGTTSSRWRPSSCCLPMGGETATLWSCPSSEAGSQDSLKITRAPLVYNKHPETVENFLNKA